LGKVRSLNVLCRPATLTSYFYYSKHKALENAQQHLEQSFLHTTTSLSFMTRYHTSKPNLIEYLQETVHQSVILSQAEPTQRRAASHGAFPGVERSESPTQPAAGAGP